MIRSAKREQKSGIIKFHYAHTESKHVCVSKSLENCAVSLSLKMETTPKKRKINKTEGARRYFDFSHTKDQKEIWVCKLCSQNLVGTNNANLTSHLKSKHLDIYQSICEGDALIAYKRQKLLFNCVQLVSVDGRVFKSLNDTAILAMNEDTLKELRLAGQEFNLQCTNLPEVKHLLHIVSDKVRDKIRDEVKGQPLCLMIDIGTCNKRSILGIRIQFILNGKLGFRSIGMVELKDSHTGEYLAHVIIKQLKVFDIDIRQIITVTTDNGANVVKMVRDIDEHAQNVDEDSQPLQETPRKKKTNGSQNLGNAESTNDSDAIDREIEAALAIPDEVSENDAFSILFDESFADENTEKNDTLLNTIAGELNQQHGIDIIWNVAGVRCEAHTLQLAVGDATRDTSLENRNVMELSKRVAKLLRLVSTHRDTEKEGIYYKNPRTEVDTRWCYKYLMVI